MELVLLGVNTKALCDEVNLNAIDVLNKTSDRRHQLLNDIPIDIWLEIASALNDLFEAVGGFLEREASRLRCHTTLLLFLLVVALAADNVANEVVDEVRGCLRACFDQSIGHNYMGQALKVLILAGRPRELLGDDVLCQVHRTVLHLGTDFAQVSVELKDDLLTLFARKNLL